LAKWVRRNTHQEFSPNPFTLEQIRRVFEEHNDPSYTNSKPEPPLPKKKRRQKILPNVSFIVSVKYCIDNFKISYNLIINVFLFFPDCSTRRRSGKSPLDLPIFNVNDIPSPPSRSPPLLVSSHSSPPHLNPYP